MKATSAMFCTLQAVIQHDRQGRYANPDLYHTSTIRALLRRGLLRVVAGGNVAPTLDGLRLVCQVELLTP